MPKYENVKILDGKLETEGNNYNVEVLVDTMGYATLEFGASFSLRLDYNNIEQLTGFLEAAKHRIEDDAIDQAAPKINVSNYTYKDPSDPSNW